MAYVFGKDNLKVTVVSYVELLLIISQNKKFQDSFFPTERRLQYVLVFLRNLHRPSLCFRFFSQFEKQLSFIQEILRFTYSIHITFSGRGNYFVYFEFYKTSLSYRYFFHIKLTSQVFPSKTILKRNIRSIEA